MIMLHARQTLAQLKVPRPRQFCTNATKPTKSSSSSKGDSNITQYKEAYQQLDKLDFMTASKILFTDPPKKKKFGIDFHLVQLFFACMPSLAVYLVAQYARHEMRKMDAELEEKRKKEEEKEKEMELKAMEKKDPELLDVKVRLDKLEETVKEIVVESKKQSDASVTKIHKDQSDDKHLATAKPGNIMGGSESNKSMEKGSLSKQENAVQVTGGVGRATEPSSVTDASEQDRRSKTQQSGSSQDDNR